MAIQFFMDCGAASDEFCKLYDRLPKRLFKKAVDIEVKMFTRSIPHDECFNCNATVWHDEKNCDEFYCDSCGETTHKNDLRSIVKRIVDRQGSLAV